MNFMPFFLPTFRANRSTSAESNGVEESGIEHQSAAPQIPDEAKAPEVAVQKVLVDVDHDEHNVDSQESHVPQRKGSVLQVRSA